VGRIICERKIYGIGKHLPSTRVKTGGLVLYIVDDGLE
jgi:hypothetical protein